MCTPETDILRKITANASDEFLLTKLHATDSVLFEENFVATMVGLAKLEVYNIKNLSNTSTLLLSQTFSQYSIAATPMDRQAFAKIFDVYFRAIGKYAGEQPTLLRSRTLALLQLQFTIPNSNVLSFQDAKVSITTNYKPKDVDLVSAKIDIESMMKDQLCEAINSAVPIDVIYSLTPGSVQLQGPLLPSLVADILILQEEMAKSTLSDGARVKSFINAQQVDNQPFTSLR